MKTKLQAAKEKQKYHGFSGSHSRDVFQLAQKCVFIIVYSCSETLILEKSDPEEYRSL